MTEAEFNTIVETTLMRIESALEQSAADLDCSMVGDGVLEIEFADGSKIVVNRHAAAQELWVAARSGGHHFRWDGLAWRDTRDGAELMAALSHRVSAQSGEKIDLSRLSSG